MATFAFARLIYLVAQNWIGLTRGPMGIPSVPPLELLPAAEALARAVALLLELAIGTRFGRRRALVAVGIRTIGGVVT